MNDSASTAIKGQVVIYFIVGLSAALLFLAVSEVVRRVADVDPAAAAAIGFLASLLPAFVGHRFLTFKSDRDVASEIRRFVVTSILLFLLTVLFTYVLSNVLLLHPFFSFILTATFVPAVNFIVLKFYVFASRSRNAAGA